MFYFTCHLWTTYCNSSYYDIWKTQVFCKVYIKVRSTWITCEYSSTLIYMYEHQQMSKTCMEKIDRGGFDVPTYLYHHWSQSIFGSSGSFFKTNNCFKQKDDFKEVKISMILKSYSPEPFTIDINQPDLCNEIKLIFIRKIKLLPNGDNYKIVYVFTFICWF